METAGLRSHLLRMMPVSFKSLVFGLFAVVLITDVTSAQIVEPRQRWGIDAVRPNRIQRPLDYRQPELRRQRRVQAPKPYVPPPGGAVVPEYGQPAPAIERIPPT